MQVVYIRETGKLINMPQALAVISVGTADSIPEGAKYISELPNFVATGGPYHDLISSLDENGEVALQPMPVRHVKKDEIGNWVAKTQAEKDLADIEYQAIKSAPLKEFENDLIQKCIDEGVVAEGTKQISKNDRKEYVERALSVPRSEGRSEKLNEIAIQRIILEELGGSMDDIHWHDDV